MRIDDQRRADNFEDRGTGSRGGRGGGVPLQALHPLVRLLGIKGSLLAAAVLVLGFFVLPAGLKQELLGALTGGGPGAPSTPGVGSVCDASPANGAACDFSRVVLASTEDVWSQTFERAALPDYGTAPGAYQHPTLVVFADSVSTGGCGAATSDVGPFYCPADQKLYIDPGFYAVMEQRLRAPGDFAQAYVIAHEVGHHVQNLNGLLGRGEVHQIETELQADCLAGAWAQDAERRQLVEIGDLDEALNAAAQIGDDTIQRKTQGRVQPETWTHGSAAQRSGAFKKGYRGGIATCLSP